MEQGAVPIGEAQAKQEPTMWGWGLRHGARRRLRPGENLRMVQEGWQCWGT